MPNAFLDWIHKKVQQDVVAPVQRNIVQPVEQHVIAPVSHFATQEIQHPYLPQPVKSATTGLWQGVNRDILHPIYRAPQNFINDVSKPIENAAMKIPLGRGLEDVGLGAARAGIGLGQAASGISDIAGHLLTGHGGTSRFSKSFNTAAKNVDTTVKAEHLNKPVYAGSQIVANVLPALITGGGTAAAKEAPVAAEDAAKLSTLQKAQNLITHRIPQTNVAGRIAAATVRSAANPKTLAYNAGFQSYSAGQQASQGKKINPVSQAESLGVFQFGMPLAGAAAKEAYAPLIKTAKGLLSKAGEPALSAAEKVSGLSRQHIVNDNEANTLRDHADRITGSYKPSNKVINQLTMQARNAANTAGIDITSGSPQEVVNRIYDYLSKRREFVNSHNQIVQGGYARIPSGKQDIAPDLSETQKNFINDYANMLEGIDSTAGVTVNREMGIRSSSNSPFYRKTYAATGHAPTKADWFNEARQQLESGKAAYGASDEYKNLSAIAANEPASTNQPLPTGSTEASQSAPAEAAPTLEAPTTPEQKSELTAVKDILERRISLPKSTSKAVGVNPPTGSLEDIGRVDDLQRAGKPIPPDLARRVGMALEPTNIAKLTPDQYARTFGVSKFQAANDLKATAIQDAERRRMTKEELANLGPEQKLSVPQKWKLIREDANQHTVNQPMLRPITHEKYSLKDRIRSSIAQAEGINQEAEHRLQRAEQVGSKLSAHDKQLFYGYDNGVPLSELVRKADKPALFDRAAKLYQDAMDYDLAAKREGGAAILKQQHYVPHSYAVSEEWLKTHGIPEDQWIKIGKYVKGFRDTQATYRSYAEARRKAGLKPLLANPIEDLKDYRRGGFNIRRNNLIGAALGRATPDDIAPLDVTRIGTDTRLTQAAGHLPFSVSDEAQKHLRGYNRLAEPRTIAGKATRQLARGVNTATKRVLFLGTPFHYTNEQTSFIGKNLLHPVNLARGEVRFIQTVATRGGYQRLLDRAQAIKLKDGTPMLEAIRKMGVVLPDDSMLNRASSAFSLTEAEAALRRGLDPNSKQAVELGQQINHLMGHRNLAVEGEDPRLHQVLSFGTLAPSWSTTQLGLLKDALIRWKPGSGGGYARSAVIGKRAVLGGAGVAGSYALSHHLPSRSQLINELGLTWKNPVPNIELNSKTKSGEGQEMVAPTDPFGLGTGLVSNPGHFVSSRMSPLLSFGTKVLTNQNWNSQPLAEGPHNAAYYRELVKNAALNSLTPIGVQTVTNLTHNPNNPNIPQGIIENFGGRLKTNPNDPKYVRTQQYYKALNNAGNTLVPGSPAQGAFYESFGVTKDPVTGKYLMAPNSEMTVAKSASLNAYPAALSAANIMAKELAKDGQRVDPFYLLNTQQQKAYNAYETMAPLSADRTDWLRKNGSWATDFFNRQQSFFNSLPKGDPNKPTNPIKYPTFSSQTNNDLNNYYSLSSSAARGTYLNTHPDVVDALNAKFNYDNAVRIARGYAPVKDYPTPPPQLNQYMKVYDAASKAERKNIRNASPQQYRQMIAFYDTLDLYTIGKAGAVSQLQGEPDYTSTEAKDIAAMAQDIYKNADGTYSVIPAGWLTGVPAGSTPAASSGSSGYSSTSYKYLNPSYVGLHSMLRGKKPGVVKLKKQTGLAKEIKASFKKPKTLKIAVAPSSISIGKKKVAV